MRWTLLLFFRLGCGAALLGATICCNEGGAVEPSAAVASLGNDRGEASPDSYRDIFTFPKLNEHFAQMYGVENFNKTLWEEPLVGSQNQRVQYSIEAETNRLDVVAGYYYPPTSDEALWKSGYIRDEKKGIVKIEDKGKYLSEHWSELAQFTKVSTAPTLWAATLLAQPPKGLAEIRFATYVETLAELFAARDELRKNFGPTANLHYHVTSVINRKDQAVSDKLLTFLVQASEWLFALQATRINDFFKSYYIRPVSVAFFDLYQTRSMSGLQRLDGEKRKYFNIALRAEANLYTNDNRIGYEVRSAGVQRDDDIALWLVTQIAYFFTRIDAPGPTLLKLGPDGKPYSLESISWRTTKRFGAEGLMADSRWENEFIPRQPWSKLQSLGKETPSFFEQKNGERSEMFADTYAFPFGDFLWQRPHLLSEECTWSCAERIRLARATYANEFATIFTSIAQIRQDAALRGMATLDLETQLKAQIPRIQKQFIRWAYESNIARCW